MMLCGFLKTRDMHSSARSCPESYHCTISSFGNFSREANIERQRFDDDVIEHCDRFLEGFSGVVRLSDLLIRLEEHACPEAVQDAVTLRVLEHFDPEDDHSIRGINVTIIGPDDLHSKRCTGDDLVIDALNRATGN